MPVQVLGVPLPIQLSVNVYGKAAEDDPSTWAPGPMRETWKKILPPGFGLAQP